jgi:hypothetical protein
MWDDDDPMRVLWYGLWVALFAVACSFSGGPGSDDNAGPTIYADAAVADAMEAPPGFSLVTYSFRDSDTYTGTRDNWLAEEDDNSRGDRDLVNWDLSHTEGLLGLVDRGETVALVGFEIFGDGADRVPFDSTIARALLVLVITDGSGEPTEMYQAGVDWDESTTWATLGDSPGPQPGEDYDEATAIPFETGGIDGAVALDVTGSVQRWSDGAANDGWLFRAGSDNGTDVRSREFDDESQRPLLRVDVLVPE